jgi:hypothetical protein
VRFCSAKRRSRAALRCPRTAIWSCRCPPGATSRRRRSGRATARRAGQRRHRAAGGDPGVARRRACWISRTTSSPSRAVASAAGPCPERTSGKEGARFLSLRERNTKRPASRESSALQPSLSRLWRVS